MTDQQKQDKSQPSGSAKVGRVDTRSSLTEDGATAETMKTPHGEKAMQRGVEGTAGPGAETGVSGETAGALKDQVGH